MVLKIMLPNLTIFFSLLFSLSCGSNQNDSKLKHKLHKLKRAPIVDTNMPVCVMAEYDKKTKESKLQKQTAKICFEKYQAHCSVSYKLRK